MAKTFGEITPLAIVLFIFWLIFTEKTNWHHLLLGAVVAYLISWFSDYLLRGRLDPHLNMGVAIRAPVYGIFLFWEIVKANWDVLKRVFNPKLPIDPRITSFESYLESDIARTVLANSITLTPGTVTVDIDGSRFYVHCLAAEHEVGLLEGTLESMVAWLFGEGPPEKRGHWR